MVTTKAPSRLTLAGVGIEMSSEDFASQRAVSDEENTDFRFKPCHDRQPADISVSVHCRQLPPPPGKKIIFSRNKRWRLYTLESGFLDCRFQHEHSEVPFWWSCIDHHYENIKIGVNTQKLCSTVDGQHLSVSPDLLATDRKLMTPALLNHGTLIFHGAGGAVHNKAFIMAGSSGIGKSTIAKLLSKAGHCMFSDECMAVRKQNNENWLACGTPWASAANIMRNDSAPLAAMLFLRKSKATKLQRLSKAESLKRILQLCCIPWHLPDFADIALSMIEHLITDIPMYELNCSLTDQPVKTIEQLALSL